MHCTASVRLFRLGLLSNCQKTQKAQKLARICHVTSFEIISSKRIALYPSVYPGNLQHCRTKSDAILFGTSQRLKPMSSLSSVKLDDSVIQLSDTIKILGATLDSSLTIGPDTNIESLIKIQGCGTYYIRWRIIFEVLRYTKWISNSSNHTKLREIHQA